MRKIYKLKSALWLLLVLLGLVPSIQAGAQLQWRENFDYPAGALYGQGSWVKHGNDYKDPINVVDQKLDYAGYPGGVSGKSVQFASTGASGEDLVANFDPDGEGILTGTIYYSALINVSKYDNGGKTGKPGVLGLVPKNGDKDINDGIMKTPVALLYIDEGSKDGAIKFGVGKNSVWTAPSFTETDYNENTTYLIVVKYEISGEGNKTSLFVNPTKYDEEPAKADAIFDDDTNISSALQGITLQQKGSFSTIVPDMSFGMLRV